MADEYYAASAGGYGVEQSSAAEYDRDVKRSTRVLSKFNKEQKETAFQMIRNSAIAIAAAKAVYTIGARTIGKLQRLVNKFTYAPMIEGLQEYTAQLEKFQAIIQNSAQFYPGEIGGARQVEEITKALDELNDYADKTIYKFSDMQNAVSSFITAGTTIKDATTMAKGLASLTAFMGQGPEAYASAAYMYNQAIQQGKMQWYQWRSLETSSGVGGYLTKKLMIETAKAMGRDAPDLSSIQTIYKDLTTGELKTEIDDDAFRDTLQDDWLTSNVLIEAMRILNKEYDEATLRSRGFSDEVIHMAMTAQDAAGKVRSYGQFMNAVIESIGTGWGRIFRGFLGDTDQATNMWTGLMNVVTDDIKSTMSIIEDAMGVFEGKQGQNQISKILNNTWKIIRNIGTFFEKMFGKINPEKLGNTLYKIVKSIADVSDVLAGNTKPANTFQTILLGIAKALGYIFSIAKRLIDVVIKLVRATDPIWKGLSKFVMNLGPQFATLLDKIVGFIESVADAFVKSGIFNSIGSIFEGASNSIGELLNGGIASFLSSIFGAINDAMGGVGFADVFKIIGDALKETVGVFEGDGEKSSKSFLETIFTLGAAIILAKPIFKNISKILGYFQGMDSKFITIILSTVAIITALNMFQNMDVDGFWSIVWKFNKINTMLMLLKRIVTKMVRIIKQIGKTFAIVFIAILIFSAMTLAVFALSKNMDDGDLAAFKVVSNFIIKLIAAISVLFFAIAAFVKARAFKGIVKGLQSVIDLIQTGVISNIEEVIETAKSARSAVQTMEQVFTHNFNFGFRISFFDGVAKRLQGVGIAFAGIGVSIWLIAKSMETLSKLSDPKPFWTGVAGLLAVAVVLGVLFVMVFKMTKTLQSATIIEKTFSKGATGKSGSTRRTSTRGFGGVIGLILTIAGAIWIISKSIELLAKAAKDPGALWQGVGIIVIISGIISALMLALSKDFLSNKRLIETGKGPSLKTILVISSIAWAVLSLAGAIALLSLLDENKVKTSGVIVVALLSIIAIVATILSFRNKTPDLKSVSSFAGLFIGVAAIAAAMAYLADVIGNGGDILSAAISIGVLLLAVMGIIFAVTKITSKASSTPANIKYLAGVIAAVAALGVVVGVLSLIDWDRLIAPTAAVILLLWTIAGVIAVITKKVGNSEMSRKQLLSFALIIGAVAILAVAVGVIAVLGQAGNILAAGLVIGGILGVMALVLYALGKMDMKSLGSIAVTIGLMIVLIYSMSEMIEKFSSLPENFDTSGMWNIFGFVAAMIGIIAALGALMVFTGGVGAAIIIAGFVAMVSVVGIISTLIESIAQLDGDFDSDDLDDVLDFLEEFMEMIREGSLMSSFKIRKTIGNFSAVAESLSGLFSSMSGISNTGALSMFDMFRDINDLDISNFESQLDKLIVVLDKFAPRLASVMADLGTFRGTLVFAVGDANVSSSTASVATPSTSNGYYQNFTLPETLTMDTISITAQTANITTGEVAEGSNENEVAEGSNENAGSTKTITERVFSEFLAKDENTESHIIYAAKLAAVKQAAKDAMFYGEASDEWEDYRANPTDANGTALAEAIKEALKDSFGENLIATLKLDDQYFGKMADQEMGKIEISIGNE